MTDQHLRELMHDRVADVAGPDLSGRAWDRAVRHRRRRNAAAVTAAAVAVVGVVVASQALTGTHRAGIAPATRLPSASGAPSVAPYDGSRTSPDAKDGGTPVWWGPTAAQEDRLPRIASPLPATIDLSGGGAPAVPIERALGAYAVLDGHEVQRVLLLTRSGDLQPVDISRVQPITLPGEAPRVPVGETMLSPTGDWLMFPQEHSLLVMDVSKGTWRTIDTGDRNTAFARWINDASIWLPSTADGGDGPTYSAVDGTRDGAMADYSVRGPLGQSATAYGRWRNGPGGTAQSWTATAGVPLPAGAQNPPQVMVVKGTGKGDDVLVFGGTGADPRPSACCGVQFWLDDQRVVYDERSGTPGLVAWKVGSHEFERVADITGLTGQETYVGSYARIWLDRAPLP